MYKRQSQKSHTHQSGTTSIPAALSGSSADPGQLNEQHLLGVEDRQREADVHAHGARDDAPTGDADPRRRCDLLSRRAAGHRRGQDAVCPPRVCLLYTSSGV